MNSTEANNTVTRRGFIAKSGAVGATAMAGFSIPKFGYGANYDKIRVGLVGAGYRGRGALVNVLSLDTNVEVVALADTRQESIDVCMQAVKEHRTRNGRLRGFHVTPERTYVGLDAYKKVIDSDDVDVVFLTTPPGFRPLHFEYAVQAGKHVFTEKPVGTDPVGIRRYMVAGKLAKEKGLGVLAGTQRRHQPLYIETIDRLRDGHIGDIVSGHVYWNGGAIWYRDRKPGMTDAEYWMYNWYHLDWMCGDHICEQHVHNLDVMNWVMGDHPVQAYGMGGRQYHTERGGNIYDHFSLEYAFADGRRVTGVCRQISNTDSRVAEHFIGTKGVALMSNQAARFTGEKPWKYSGDNPRNTVYDFSREYEIEHMDFITSLRNGSPLNEAQQVAESTMTAILGREAAYTGKVVQWDDLLASSLDLMPRDVAHWDGSIRPVPKPGVARG